MNTADIFAHATTTGGHAHATTTGNDAHALTAGYSAHATTAGNYAPRKLLAEAQARIAALEMLVRCADELLAGSEPVLARIYNGGDTRDWVYKDDWRDEAAKLLEVGDV